MAQLRAIAWLRWRMFLNGFRRQNASRKKPLELVLGVLLRMIVWPILVCITIGPVAACGYLAWHATAYDRPDDLLALLTGVFFLWQFIAVNGIGIAAATSSFDPSSLLRFPLPFARYLLLRTVFGLLTPSTIVGCLGLLAAAIGIGIASPASAPAALIVLGVYALTNILFTRMLAVWLDRWLALRRSREIFGVLMTLLVVSTQLINMPGILGTHRHTTEIWFRRFLAGAGQTLHWLPPGFATESIVPGNPPLSALVQFAGLLAWSAVFLAVLALRVHKEFLGEFLTDGSGPKTQPALRSKRALPKTSSLKTSVIRACLWKEWLYFRDTARLQTLIVPLFFVFILSRGIFALHPRYFLPGAIAYVLLTLLIGLYNVFGADGNGVQLYLLAPIRLRDVLLAKNIASLILIAVEVGLAWILVSLLAHSAIPLSTQISTAFWTIFVVALNLTVGMLRSIQSPRKFIPGQPRQTGSPTNRNSALLVLALCFGSLLLQVPVQLMARHFNQPWLGAMAFAPLAAASIAAYAVLLRNADRLILSHRDVLAEELCRQ